MQPKFKIGDVVRLKCDSIHVEDAGVEVCVESKGLYGKVKGTIETSGECCSYFVEVKVPTMTLTIKLKEDQLMGPKDCFDNAIDEMMKWKGLDSFKIGSHIIPSSSKPDPNSWIKQILDKFERESKPSFEKILREMTQKPICLSSGLGRWSGIDAITGFPVKIGIDLAYAPLPKSESESDSEKKMPKSRCIKLLESYRAEREKVAKGRRFERCLRESVINEALERAIELLKSEQ